MKRIAFLVTFAIICNSFIFAFADYSDITTHWSKRFVEELSSKGLIDGYPDGNFNPDATLDVSSFLKLTLNAIGYDCENAQGDWAKNYIDKAVELEIIEEDTFDSYNRPIKRGEMAVIIANALNLSTDNISDKKSIIKEIPDYYDILNDYKDAVLACYDNNIMTGYDDGSFMFDKSTSRAEATVIVSRMLKLSPRENKNENIDMSNEYYVAQNGNDANDGTKDKPFKTIEKARDKIREIKKYPNYKPSPITVYLRDGEYYIENTIEFNSEDSGEKDSPITYKAYENEKVRLTGGISLPYEKFTSISEDMSQKLLSAPSRKKVLQLDLNALDIKDLGVLSRRGYLISADVTPQGELYIDNTRCQLSRWPNSEWVGTTGIIRAGTRSKSKITGGAEFSIDYDEPTKWKTNINEIYTAGVLGENYFYGYFPIEKIEKGKITLKEGAVKDYYSKHFIRYENIFEEIDEENEYYIDRQNKVLYLYPTEKLNKNSDIRLSMLKENMISVKGTSYLNFENIQFDTMRSGGIIAKEVDNFNVKNCNVFGTGGNGININGNNCIVSNNEIYDIGVSGISISGGDYENAISNNNIVANNHIHKVSQIERSYTSGIFLGYRSVGTIVRNNEIHDTPHTAMIIYGPKHLIEYNNIYDVVNEYLDMDAIYLNVYQYPWERGVTIRQNYFHDFGNEMFTQKQINVAAIRSDNNGNGINVLENVFYNIGYSQSNQVRCVCAEGIQNKINNNIFVDVSETYDGPEGYDKSAKWDLTSKNVEVAYKDFQIFAPTYSKEFPEITDFFKHHWKAYEKSNEFLGNLIVNTKLQLSTLNAEPNQQGFRASAELVNAKDNLRLKTDPGFIDYKNNNFQLSDNSEVYTKIPNFPKIDFSKMGLLKDVTVGVLK